MNLHSFNRLPNSVLLKKFEEWETLRKAGASIEELIMSVGRIATGCPFKTIIPEGIPHFYRARKNLGNEMFNNVSDLWYPPEKLVRYNGRANRAGSSILYISELPRTTLFEMNLQDGDYITIAKIGVCTGEKLNFQYITKLEEIKRKNFEKILLTKLKGLNKNGLKNQKLIHDFISNEFTKIKREDESDSFYNLSIAITEFLLAYKNADGLVYPSIKSPNDMNIVVKKEAANKKLKILDLKCITVKNPTKNSLEIKSISKVKSIDRVTGALVWQDDTSGVPFWNDSDRFGIRKA